MRGYSSNAKASVQADLLLVLLVGSLFTVMPVVAGQGASGPEDAVPSLSTPPSDCSPLSVVNSRISSLNATVSAAQIAHDSASPDNKQSRLVALDTAKKTLADYISGCTS